MIARLPAMLAAAVLVAGTMPAAGASGRPKGTRMENPFARCEPRSATLHLVGEQVMTRAAITPETIERHAPAIAIPAGDPRLARLAATVKTLPLEPAALPQFEIRLLARIECADGSTHTLLGSRTGEDGRLDLSIDGTAASTHAPLRKELDALVTKP